LIKTLSRRLSLLLKKSPQLTKRIQSNQKNQRLQKVLEKRRRKRRIREDRLQHLNKNNKVLVRRIIYLCWRSSLKTLTSKFSKKSTNKQRTNFGQRVCPNLSFIMPYHLSKVKKFSKLLISKQLSSFLLKSRSNLKNW